MLESIEAHKSIEWLRQKLYFEDVSTVLVPRSKAEIERDIAAIERTSKKIARSKKTARAWLIKYGFMTKDGRPTKRYGG